MRSNEDIAAALDEIADLLDIDGDNPFRTRAYRNAAKAVRELPGPAFDADLTAIKGIGDVLAGKIKETARTGSFDALERAREKWPATLRSLLNVPGLGPKKTRILHDELGVKSVIDLKRVVDQELLRGIPALGPKLEEKLKKTLLSTSAAEAKRFPLAEVEPIAVDLVARVLALPGVSRAEAAGSYRRKKASVGDLDILACCADGQATVSAFVKFPRVASVLAEGDTRGSVTLDNGLQIDLRVVDAGCYGAALLYFTGSKGHGIELRSAAIKKGWKVNEYGLWDGETMLAGATEESMYEALGMPYLTPEQRER